MPSGSTAAPHVSGLRDGGGMTISRRPNRRPSREKAPGPSSASATAAIIIPAAAAERPTAARNSSRPTPGLPPGNVEYSLCSANLPGAHKETGQLKVRGYARRLKSHIAESFCTTFEVLVLCFACRIDFLELDDSAMHGNRDCLCTVAGAEFFHDVLDVDLDGFFGDKKLVGNISIAVATCNMIEDFYFARGQVFVTHVLRELRRQLRRNTLLPSMDLANHFHQLLWRHALEQVAAGARFQCALDFDVAFEGRQHDHAR